MLMSVNLKEEGALLTPSAPKPVMPVVVEDSGVSPYEPAPDGRRILVTEPDKAAHPLKLIVNWPALFNRPAR